ncbi:MAG: FISUMP domain-containing protein [Bacteroidales bacterium]
MKKTSTLFLFFLLSGSLLSFSHAVAQAPDKMSYQAVIRDAGDQLVTDQQVGLRVSILQSSIDGTVVYQEIYNPNPVTNNNGLLTIEIGEGVPVTGTFSEIDWADGPYFIKTETDPSGGTDYTITGTSQLLSVPYALHSGTSDVLTGEITESQISDLQDYLTEETDPLFTGSPSSGIEADDIDNWDNAYLWGDHAGEGYLTEESDPVFEASSAAGIEADDIDNWDEAHGWGDHSAEGYLTDYTETDPSVPSGTQTGEMQYWDGSEWITVSPGTDGQVLTFSNGVPAWSTTVGWNDLQNPATGNIWMDRNLGASQVATSSDDDAAYGDLYQWGRGADGHQIRTSATTEDLSDSDTPGHGDFILAPDSPYDWRSPQNGILWQGVNGTNNPCPSGYRLPTEAEWDEERASWISEDPAGAFDSPLKLPVAGYRNYGNGSLESVGFYGHYWSSTVDGNNSRNLYFYSSNAGMVSNLRAYGGSVRCLKD